MIDINRFIAVPYLDGGRSYSGADCWGQLLLVREALGLPELDSLPTTRRDTPGRMQHKYREVASNLIECDPTPGAIAAVFKAKVFVHVAVVLEIEGRLAVLETNPKGGARWLPVNDFLARYTSVKFYRDPP